jgi:nucleotide-binding universal stress UspA family protein
MYEVLLAVDKDEERANHQAQYVSSLPCADEEVRATIMFVYPANEDYKGAPPHEFEDIDAAVAAADHLESEGIAVERETHGGDSVSHTIIDRANELDADEIVMGGRKQTGVTKLLLGSIAEDVMLSADRPVTITG